MKVNYRNGLADYAATRSGRKYNEVGIQVGSYELLLLASVLMYNPIQLRKTSLGGREWAVLGAPAGLPPTVWRADAFRGGPPTHKGS